MKKETQGFIEIFIASLLFGLLPIVVRFGEGLGVYSMSFFRILVAILCISFFMLFQKMRLAPLKQEKSKIFLFGAIHGFIVLGFFLAIQYLSIASAVLLLYSSSIWIVVFSWLILKEPIQKKTIIALIIAFLGLILVADPQNFFLKESLIGSLSGLFSGIGMGLVYVLSKTFKHYDKVSLTFWQNLIALPLLFPLIFLDTLHFTIKNLSINFLLGSLFTAVPFILIFKGFEKIDTQKGSIIIMLDIVFSIIFAYFLFSEKPSSFAIFGGILIMVGSYYTKYKRTWIPSFARMIIR